MNIAAILDRIDDNQIFVPTFQREYVWKKDNAKELIDSLIKDYPFGTMLTWDTTSPPKLKGKHEYKPEQGAVKIILDGQQRITTLYMLIKGKIPPYYKEEEIKNDVRDLYVNLVSLELSYYKRTIMENDPFWVNLTNIFKKKIDLFDIADNYKNKNGEDLQRDKHRLISDNIRKIENILDRSFPQQVIPVYASTREAIDIFYKVNDGGIKLTDAELALAQISGYWPEARDLFKFKIKELSRDGFELELDHIIYAILGCMYNIGSDMKKLHSDDNINTIKDVWIDLDKNTLDYVFNILRSRAYVDHTKEINSIYAIIPLIVYKFNKKDDLSEIEIKKCIKWFYYSQIRRRYVSQLPQKLDYDLKIVKESFQPFDDLLSVIEQERRLKILPEEFERVGILHPLWSIMKFVMKSKKAICLTTGINIQQNMGSKYQLEWDHIFPWSKLKVSGYNFENLSKYQLAQEITNRAILTQVGNRKKSNQPAKDYLNSVKIKFPNSLNLQMIPEDENLWEIENYELFLTKRRILLANEINKFLENITETLPFEKSYSIEDVINIGETQEVEFKQTFRWDTNKEIKDKNRELDIMKCIAAFANSNGGTLFIGVSDDKEIIGLDMDYKSLRKDKDGNKDIFEIDLREIIVNNFGEVFTASNLDISFPIIDNREICMIEIKPIKKPEEILILKKKDNQGKVNEILYVRSGNSSRIIPPNEYGLFYSERFN